MYKYKMGGGLLHLASFGLQDIFLTGNPQITFFKIVYRKYTNFAIEPIKQFFFSQPNFGQEITCVVDKFGDLINKAYLEIDISKVDLIKNTTYWNNNKVNAKKEFEEIDKFYQIFVNYISANINIARKLDILLKTNNISIIDVENIMNNVNFLNELINSEDKLHNYLLNNEIQNIIELNYSSYNFIQLIKCIDIRNIFFCIVKKINTLTNILIDKKCLMKKIKIMDIINKILYNEIYDFYKKIYDLHLEKQKIYQSFLDNTYVERYKFAWVEELGHALIDQIEIRIGNSIIDKHTGDWLILFNKIMVCECHIDNYNKMIGNVDELIIFDDNIKNTYKLIVPLQFWFCRYIGLSLPIIALRYSDIIINIKIKELSKLCYVEDDPNLMDIANIQSLYNINITNCNLYIDNIFLDSDERTRFAQSTHEYLIEIVQYNEFDNIDGKEYNAHLNFTHPTKFIIWFCQPKYYRENPTGRNKCQWNNFGTENDKTGYSMNSSFYKT